MRSSEGQNYLFYLEKMEWRQKKIIFSLLLWTKLYLFVLPTKFCDDCVQDCKNFEFWNVMNIIICSTTMLFCACVISSNVLVHRGLVTMLENQYHSCIKKNFLWKLKWATLALMCQIINIILIFLFGSQVLDFEIFGI
jgi:hypothetical protein